MQKLRTAGICFLPSVYFSKMPELKYFYNKGFGWICKSCEREIETHKGIVAHSRLMREGESESKIPRFSNSALAKWMDEERKILMCPRCKITEAV